MANIKNNFPSNKEKDIFQDREEVFAKYQVFVESLTSPFARHDSAKVIKSSLRSLFKKIFNVDNEDEIASIILNPGNASEFKGLVDLAKEKYKLFNITYENLLINCIS